MDTYMLYFLYFFILLVQLPNHVCIDSDKEIWTYGQLFSVSFNFPSKTPVLDGASLTSVRLNKLFSSFKTIHKLVPFREPVVFTNHSAMHWRATQWNLIEMGYTIWDNLDGVLSLPAKLTNQKLTDELQLSTFFTTNHLFDTGTGLLRLSAVGRDITQPKLLNKMTMMDYLSGITLLNPPIGSDTKLFRYLFSTEYDDLEEKLKLHDDSSWKELLLSEPVCEMISKTCNLTVTGGDAAENPSPLLHMLYPGAAIQARYSEYHTVRVQLQGVGRYYLFPPQSVVNGMHLYPSIHQYASQTQTSMYKEELFQGSTSAVDAPSSMTKAQETVLQAGQLLYVPPFWTVHSEAQTFSVLLDVLSVSQEQQLLAPAFHMALPFDSDQVETIEQRIVAAQVFLVHVLSRVTGLASVRRFAQSLYYSRFSTLFPEEGLFLQKRAGFQCLRDEPKIYDNLVHRLDPARVQAAAEFVASRLNNALFEPTKIYKDLKAPGKRKRVPNHQGGVRGLWLGNYVEQIARWAMMGNADEAVLFIRECLHMDDVIEVVQEVLGPGVIKLKPEDS